MALEDYGILIRLDVFDVEETCAFWVERLGFEVVAREVAGSRMERRVLRHPGASGLGFMIRSCAPRPAAGCGLGSVRAIVLRVNDVEAAVARAGGVEEASGPLNCPSILDPNGYRFELLGGPPGGS